MSMSVGESSGDDAMCDINTTPLIDVMLVLLIMLILTLPVMNHAVKLDLPQDQHLPPPPVPPEVIDLEIYSDGTIVYDGNTVPNLHTLEGYFQTEAVKDPQPEIHLRPDRRARYEVVAEVLAAAQRNHMKRIGFTNTAEFSQ